MVTFANTSAVLPGPGPTLVFDHGEAKARYGMDAYILDLDGLAPNRLTTQAAYWYSMWSHRRNQAWKGYLQVDLSPSEDAAASTLLAVILAKEAL